MKIDGSIILGARDVRRHETFPAIDPATGETLPQAFCETTPADVVAACEFAETAAGPFAALMPEARAHFLEAVALGIEVIGDQLIVTAMAETGLPRARLENERGRTTGQLRMFAAELRRGAWLDVTIDSALPERTPPRADLRRMNIPLGPVAVFGASNFPLAFSTAGGDTASAFAAGCPVVVKGHPAHPGTGELVGRVIRAAVQNCGLPEGVFSFLPGRSNALGAALVSDPRIKAVGFTGSRSGGLALIEVARRRPDPIPVYAEMSSINPVLLLPHALASRTDALAAGFVASLTLGAGQFCTNPGLVIALDGPDLDRFINAAGQALAAGQPAVMLTPGIHAAYGAGVAALNRKTRRVGEGMASEAPHRCVGALFDTTAAAFTSDATLADEVFGASSLVVRCKDFGDMAKAVAALEGQLTATLQLDPADEAEAAPILAALQAKAGRVLANGWPTGVEVTPAMVHGGPFPATSDGRTTSVGTLAMMRFLRPICFQDMPDALLPPALQAANPWRLPRRVDGAGKRV